MVRKLSADPALFAEMSRTHSALVRSFQGLNLEVTPETSYQMFSH